MACAAYDKPRTRDFPPEQYIRYLDGDNGRKHR